MGFNELVEFLQEKSTEQFNVTEGMLKDHKAFIVIESRNESYALTKLNGIRFNGEKVPLYLVRKNFLHFFNSQLMIKYVKNDGPSAMSQQQRDLLVKLVESHYNSQAKFLNLANLQSKEHGGVKIDFNSPAFMKVLFGVMQEKCPDVILPPPPTLSSLLLLSLREGY